MQEKDLHNRWYAGQYQRTTLLRFLFMAIYFFLKSLQIKFKDSTTNYDPDACWYITVSSITSLEVLLLIIISWEHF